MSNVIIIPARYNSTRFPGKPLSMFHGVDGVKRTLIEHKGTSSVGERRFVPMLARAALAVGCAALFIKTHEDPNNAPSDGPNMVPLGELMDILEALSRSERYALSFSVGR